MIDYNKRLVEVDEILKYLSKEDLLKIPEDIRQLIKNNKDKEYTWQYDETKPLKDQNVSRDTIAFLSYLNMEYLLNERQKQYMQQLHELNERKLEEEKAKKYIVDDLFKNRSIKVTQEPVNNSVALTEYKESLFTKIKNWFKQFLRK